MIWARVSSYRPRFTRQLRVADYVIDLACRSVKIGVEFDGSQHQRQIRYDEERTAFLRGLGWQVIRLWNSDVMANPDGAAEHILKAVARRMGTHPPAPPFQGGEE